MEEQLMITIAYIVVGILQIIIGIPLIFEKIKPNPLYGFRLGKNMPNEYIWYKTNKYVGRDFVLAGFIIIVLSLIFLIYKSNFSLVETAFIGATILITSVVIILIRGLLHFKKL
jgi:uncharacterized membrane protein